MLKNHKIAVLSEFSNHLVRIKILKQIHPKIHPGIHDSANNHQKVRNGVGMMNAEMVPPMKTVPIGSKNAE